MIREAAAGARPSASVRNPRCARRSAPAHRICCTQLGVLSSGTEPARPRQLLRLRARTVVAWASGESASGLASAARSPAAGVIARARHWPGHQHQRVRLSAIDRAPSPAIDCAPRALAGRWRGRARSQLGARTMSRRGCFPCGTWPLQGIGSTGLLAAGPAAEARCSLRKGPAADVATFSARAAAARGREVVRRGPRVVLLARSLGPATVKRRTRPARAASRW